MFDKPARGIVRAFELDKAVEASMIRIHPLVYGARIVGYVFISTMIGVALISAALVTRPGLPGLLSLVLPGIVLPIVVLTVFIAYPVVVRSRRKSLVESELPFLASYVSIMARGGVSFAKAVEVFRRSPLFKGLRLEAQEFYRRIALFGRDPLAALEEVASRHPSQTFKDFVLGYVITLRTGGDVVHYLEAKVEDFFRRQGEVLRQMVQRLGLYIEMYMLVAVVGGISLQVLFTSIGGVQAGGGSPGGIDPLTITLFNFAVLPVLSAAVLYMAHNIQPRWGFGVREIPYTLALSIVMAPLVYLLATLATGGYLVFNGIYTRQSALGQVTGVAAALLTASIPPWLVYRKATKGVRILERSAASYIESVSELRKTGLSPERSLIEASKRDHGPLNPVVRRLAVALEMGLDLEEAVRRSLAGVRSWLLRVMFRFTADSIKVGGGSPEIFYTLSRYVNAISEAYERLRSSLRIYVLLPYMGSVLFTVTSVIYLSLVILQPASMLQNARTSPETVYRLIMISGTASLINSWLSGLVAGKVSGLSMGEGFKHASILTIVSIVVTWIFALAFVPP